MDRTMNRQRPLTGILALLLLYFTTAANAQNGFTAFQYYQSLIYIKVKVNNKPGLTFLLNTGASTSVLHTQTADMLRLPVTGQDSVEGTAGKEAVKVLHAGRIATGNVQLENLKITRRNLEKWPTPNGKTLDGILGMDFLAHFVITIDYRNRKIAFSPKADKTAYKQTLPFTMEDGIPRLHVVLNDSIAIPIRYNSGVSLATNRDIFINISNQTWRLLKSYEMNLTPQQYLVGSGVGGNVYLPVVRIRSMLIQDFLVKLPYIVVQPEEGYFKKEDAIGFFGNNFLEKYEKVCLDFNKKQISFNMPKQRAANITMMKKTQPAKTSKKLVRK
jgi:hypothetical protein